MASAQAIANAIEARVKNTKVPKYADWRIGITQNPKQRKKDWNDPQYWLLWKADSLEDAQAVEAHFIEKGMDGGTGGDLEDNVTTYVYIF